MSKAEIAVKIVQEKNGLDLKLSYKGKSLSRLHNSTDIKNKSPNEIAYILVPRIYTETLDRVFGDRNWELVICDFT